MSLLLCLALACGTLTLRQVDAQLADRLAELARTRRDLDDLHQRLTGLSQAESTSLNRLEALREQVTVTRRYVIQLSDLVETRTSEVAAASREIEEASLQLDSRKAALSRRLVTIHKYGRYLPLRAVIESDSPGVLYRRMFYLRWLARADRRLADELAVLKSELTVRRSRLVDARAELERLREEHVAQERRLLVTQEDESALLRRLRSERTAQHRVANELAAAVGRLQDLIHSLEQQRIAIETPDVNHHFIVNKGRLAWPARGEIVAHFGTQVHPRYKTSTANNGIDIATRTGGPALAVHDGKVAYADQFLGYGRLVILDHGSGFYTLYGNLEEIAVTVGEDVATARAVGRTRDYLHFEIRRAGQPVDPLQWLEP